MLKLPALIPARDLSHDTLQRMKACAASIDQAITTIESDSSRSSEWKRDQMAKTRAAALGAMSSDLALLQSLAAQVSPSKEAWTSTIYLLGLQQFSPDPSINAQMRSAALSELGMMPAALLSMVIKNALEENNLPLLYLGYLATAEADRLAIDLSRVVIADQSLALQAIREILNAPTAAELHARSSLASSSSRVGANAILKMQVARQMAA